VLDALDLAELHEVNLQVVVQQLPGVIVPNVKRSMIALVILEPAVTNPN
jgi:hypothetical protein